VLLPVWLSAMVTGLGKLILSLQYRLDPLLSEAAAQEHSTTSGMQEQAYTSLPHLAFHSPACLPVVQWPLLLHSALRATAAAAPLSTHSPAVQQQERGQGARAVAGSAA